MSLPPGLETHLRRQGKLLESVSAPPDPPLPSLMADEPRPRKRKRSGSRGSSAGVETTAEADRKRVFSALLFRLQHGVEHPSHFRRSSSSSSDDKTSPGFPPTFSQLLLQIVCLLEKAKLAQLQLLCGSPRLPIPDHDPGRPQKAPKLSTSTSTSTSSSRGPDWLITCPAGCACLASYRICLDASSSWSIPVAAVRLARRSVNREELLGQVQQQQEDEEEEEEDEGKDGERKTAGGAEEEEQATHRRAGRSRGSRPSASTASTTAAATTASVRQPKKDLKWLRKLTRRALILAAGVAAVQRTNINDGFGPNGCPSVDSSKPLHIFLPAEEDTGSPPSPAFLFPESFSCPQHSSTVPAGGDCGGMCPLVYSCSPYGAACAVLWKALWCLYVRCNLFPDRLAASVGFDKDTFLRRRSSRAVPAAAVGQKKSLMSSTTTQPELPRELLLHILTFLSFPEALSSFASVSRTWFSTVHSLDYIRSLRGLELENGFPPSFHVWGLWCRRWAASRGIRELLLRPPIPYEEQQILRRHARQQQQQLEQEEVTGGSGSPRQIEIPLHTAALSFLSWSSDDHRLGASLPAKIFLLFQQQLSRDADGVARRPRESRSPAALLGRFFSHLTSQRAYFDEVPGYSVHASASSGDDDEESSSGSGAGGRSGRSPARPGHHSLLLPELSRRAQHRPQYRVSGWSSRFTQQDPSSSRALLSAIPAVSEWEDLAQEEWMASLREAAKTLSPGLESLAAIGRARMTGYRLLLLLLSLRSQVRSLALEDFHTDPFVLPLTQLPAWRYRTAAGDKFPSAHSNLEPLDFDFKAFFPSRRRDPAPTAAHDGAEEGGGMGPMHLRHLSLRNSSVLGFSEAHQDLLNVFLASQSPGPQHPPRPSLETLDVSGCPELMFWAPRIQHRLRLRRAALCGFPGAPMLLNGFWGNNVWVEGFPECLDLTYTRLSLAQAEVLLSQGTPRPPPPQASPPPSPSSLSPSPQAAAEGFPNPKQRSLRFLSLVGSLEPEEAAALRARHADRWIFHPPSADFRARGGFPRPIRCEEKLLQEFVSELEPDVLEDGRHVCVIDF